MAYGDEYDPNQTGAGFDAPPGMTWDPVSQMFVPASGSATGGDQSGINPMTGLPFNGLTPGPTSGIDPSIGYATPPGLHYDNGLTAGNPLSGTTATQGPGLNGGGGGAAGGPGNGLTGLLGPFGGTFTPPSQIPNAGVPNTPVFTPPGFNKPPAFTYPDFKLPTQQDLVNDPTYSGFQFTLGQGEKAIQQANAAKGILNTGGTYKGLIDYSQAAGNQYVSDAINRALGVYGTNRSNALDTYNTNYNTQYADPYKFAYQGALDAFQPQMTAYSTQAAANQHQNDTDWTHAFDVFNSARNYDLNYKNSTFKNLYDYFTA